MTELQMIIFVCAFLMFMLLLLATYVSVITCIGVAARRRQYRSRCEAVRKFQ